MDTLNNAEISFIKTSIDQLNEKIDLLIAGSLSNQAFLTLQQVSTYTGLSVDCIYNMTHKKTIPFYKPRGGRIYFKREEIDAWQLRNRVKTQEEIIQEASRR